MGRTIKSLGTSALINYFPRHLFLLIANESYHIILYRFKT